MLTHARPVPTQQRVKLSALTVTLAISVLKGVRFPPSVPGATIRLRSLKFVRFAQRDITALKGLQNQSGVRREHTRRRDKQLVKFVQLARFALRVLLCLHPVLMGPTQQPVSLNVRRVPPAINVQKVPRFQLSAQGEPTLKKA